jgi:hypothetical protein
VIGGGATIESGFAAPLTRGTPRRLTGSAVRRLRPNAIKHLYKSGVSRRGHFFGEFFLHPSGSALPRLAWPARSPCRTTIIGELARPPVLPFVQFLCAFTQEYNPPWSRRAIQASLPIYGSRP